MAKMKWYDWLSVTLLTVGGINWAFYGLWNFNLVVAIFGVGFLAKLVYALIGLSGVYSLVTFLKLAVK